MQSKYGSKHVTLTSITLEVGGIEKQYVRLANELVRRGHKVDFVLCKKNGPFLDLLDPSVNVIELTGIPVPRRNLLALAIYLAKNKPDAILGGHDAINVLLVIAKAISFSKTRIVTVAHNTLSISWAEQMSFKKRVFKIFLKYFWVKADRIAAVSGGAASSLATLIGIPSSRISVPYVPVVDSKMIELANESIDEPWFSDGKGPVALLVGRLSAQKNIGLAIDAIKLVNEKTVCRLLVLGEGEERSQLESRLEQLGMTDLIKMPGSKPNPYAYMRMAQTLVLSSVREGLPAVLIEGLAVGIPIISTDCPSGADEILENGKWGQLVPMNDAQQLAEAIEKSISLPHKIEPESYSRFTIEASTDAYEKLLFGT